MYLLLLRVLGPIVDRVSQAKYRWFARQMLTRSGVHCAGSPLWISSKCFLDVGGGRIFLGDACVISHFACVLTHDFSLDAASRALGLPVSPDYEFSRVADVSIGENAFIGMGAILMPGVSIGKGSIVAAGSVVTRDVADNTVVAGNPAREVKPTAALIASSAGRFKIDRRRR